MDSDSDFYGDEDEVAALESRAKEFDVQAHWRDIDEHDTVHSGRKKDSASSPSSAAMTPAAAAPKLHNPYEGQLSAKQLNETMTAFLSRLPPATTDVTPDIPWIYIANPFIPREGGAGGEEAPGESGAQLSTFIEGGGERLELFGDFLRTVDEKKRGGGGGRVSAAMSRQVTAEREGCVNDILMLARAMKVRTGKWMLFVEPGLVNEVWERVATATARNELGIAAKVAPREERGSARERLVCIYTYDFRDRDDVARVLHRLRQLELVRDRASGKPIYYKADAFTYLGIGSGNPWGVRASLYSSRDIFGYLKEKEGKSPTKKKPVSKTDDAEEEGWEF
ncbi:hypothetical protein SLS64_010919 [Diaporthe eres]|uniref:DUF1917-domain-containing protein n=1 Tax=Diaporthe eres TaxID=83184 RepID=A0ABR1P6X6_DIAER